GDDRFVLTNTGRVAIAVAGGAGTDTIQATGTGFLLSDARLIGTVPASLREIERAELTGTAAGDTFDARSFSGSVVLEGLGGNDQLLAGAGASSLLGGSGDDTLEGGAGGDVLLGGDGTDTLKGNGGADTLEGAAGNDGMDGGPGSDTVKVGADADITLTDAAVTGDGADTLTAVEAAALTTGPGAHTVDATGFTGATRITGGPADDVLLGGSGPDVIRGGAGNDLVRGNLGRDDLGGDAGIDTLSYAGMSSPVGVALGAPSGGPADEPDTLAADFEILEGGTAGDSLTGDAGPNTLLGGPGNDALAGGGGDDSIVGGDGTDTVVAVGDVDLVLTPTALTGLGTDALSTIEAAALAVGPGPHTVNATAFTGPAQITGGPAADVLLGGSGPDLIRGAGGDDLVRGGPGRDDLGGDAGSDTLSYADATTPVVAALGAPSGGPTADPDVLAADFEHLEGGSSRDRLTGDGGPNVLRGGPGNDVLDGAGGPDVHEGGPGNDALLGGPGGPGDGDVHSGGDGIDMINYGGRTTGVRVTVGVGADDGSPGEGDDVRGDIETVVGSKAADVIVAAPAGASSRSSLRAGATGKLFLVAGLSGNDRITGGPGNDALGGGKGNDVVDGGPGNDVLGGGSGKDKLKGAAGNDRIYGHKGADDIDGGAGDDVGFSLDEEADEVDCGPGSDLMLGDPKDVPALAKLAKLKPGKSPKPSSGSTRPVSSGCDNTVAKPDKPKAPGATPSGGDQTCSDGDAIWGNEGDGAGCDPFDPNETLDP
ncbi:beta strand repeat-containing protein, partial [Paraconexibacter sp.]|uniref:beta strand repeat-containing protein n=1 Tax=Paraconexibacter sp. TaxID=2949640 RepID=UPI0035669F4D